MPKKKRTENILQAAIRHKLETLIVRTGQDQPLPTSRQRLSNQEIADALEAGLLTRNQLGDYELTPRAQSLIGAQGRTKSSPKSGPTAHAQSSANMSRRIIRRAEEVPLDWLFKHRDKSGCRWISQAQYEAGRRLGADFHAARMGPVLTMRWQPDPAAQGGRNGRPHAGLEHSERAAAAAARTRAALAAVDPELSGVLIDVCCYEKGLETAEKSAGWPARSAKVVLTLALESLARHYGLTRARNVTSEIVHWGTADYRPTIDPSGS